MREREPSRAFVTLAIAADAAAIVVIGGGVVGSRKILSLIGQGVRVRVVSPEIADRLKPLLADGCIEWVRETYRVDHLNDACVVVAATSDSSLNATITRDARQRGLLACNASSADDSDVLFPAIHAHECATIAIHTRGEQPRYAKQLRDHVAALLTEFPLIDGGSPVTGVGPASSCSETTGWKPVPHQTRHRVITNDGSADEQPEATEGHHDLAR